MFVCSQDFELNEILMQTTFPVVGSNGNGGQVGGTAFLLLRRFASQPTQGSLSGLAVLVTATHIFDDIKGDTASIVLRVRDNSGKWKSVVANFHIRKNGSPMWTGVPNSDVAVMYVTWPKEITMDTIVPTDVLADDEALTKAKAGPGIELKVLGYPLGTTNDAAFPILRTGMIASYPLLPTEVTKTFLLDFKVFKGNSGGPVYYAPRQMEGSATICCFPVFIMGLVSQEKSLPEAYSQIQLSLGVIVHASIIKASIEMLPKPDTREAVQAVVPLEVVNH